jgi:hypothetical protein
VKLFDFIDLSLDEALRQFLSRFCLAGETQVRGTSPTPLSKWMPGSCFGAKK